MTVAREENGREDDTCDEDGCEEPTAVRIYDPRGADREVCVACARSLSQQRGVVAAPLADADVEWP